MANTDLLEAALEPIETLVDTSIDSEIVKAIPIVGTMIKFLNGVSDIRDRLYARKILRFIEDLKSISEKEQKRLHASIVEKPEEVNRVAETLLITLERITTIEKSSILSALFLAYIDNQLNAVEFKRLCAAVDQAFVDDLQEFVAYEVLPEKSMEVGMQYLSPSGLTMPIGGLTLGDVGKIYYKASQMGALLCHAYKHGMKIMAHKGD